MRIFVARCNFNAEWGNVMRGQLFYADTPFALPKPHSFADHSWMENFIELEAIAKMPKPKKKAKKKK